MNNEGALWSGNFRLCLKQFEICSFNLLWKNRNYLWLNPISIYLSISAYFMCQFQSVYNYLLSTCLHLSIYLSLSISIYLSLSISIYLSLSISIYLSQSAPYLSIYLSIYLSLSISIYYLSILNFLWDTHYTTITTIFFLFEYSFFLFFIGNSCFGTDWSQWPNSPSIFCKEDVSSSGRVKNKRKLHRITWKRTLVVGHMVIYLTFLFPLLTDIQVVLKNWISFEMYNIWVTT